MGGHGRNFAQWVTETELREAEVLVTEAQTFQTLPEGTGAS
jgi:hypothetical protein